MKTNIKCARILSLTIIASLAAGSLTACGSDTGAAVISDAEDISAEVSTAVGEVSAASGSHGSEQGKEETVYVIADASGKTEDTIVSAWLKNPEERDVIEDYSLLTDIENVKGEESFTAGAAGEMTWQAEGNDIYYQGNYDGELPLAVNISYELDGKDISPEELAGADGHLVISFTYENQTEGERTVGGENVTLYQPFTVVSGLALDDETAENVTIDSGKVINSGSQNIVVGIAFPGLTESLGLNELTDENGVAVEVNIPESITVEADVTDFSLLTTVTLVSNSALDDLDLDDVSTIDDLMDAMEEMSDASGQLKDGAGELYDGVGELADGSGTLSDGVGALAAGVSELDAGAGELYSNMGSLVTGLGSIKSALKGSSGNSVYEGAAALAAGADQISAGLVSGSNDNPGIYEAALGIGSGADEIAGGASQISVAAGQVQDGLSQAADGVSQLTGGLASAESANEAAETALNQLLTGESLASLTSDQITAIKMALTYIDGSSQYIAGVSSGISDMGSSLGEANAALSDMSSGADAIAAGAGELSSAAGTVAAGAQSLAAGAGQVSSGAAALETGIDEMISGNGGNNLNTMISGAQQLADGSAALKNGTSSLKSGVDELSDGSDALVEGMTALLDGAGSLYDGMAEFDEEGIETLRELFEDDASGLIDRVNALKDYAGEYNTFSGCREDMPCTVRFIIRTESIG